MAYITLLSDFGLQDVSVASAKGILMREIAGCEITDISHLVEPYHVQQAAYLLNAAYSSFPLKSFHLALCDIFSVPQPKILLLQNKGHYFIAPDNGILSLAFNDKYDAAWVILDMSKEDRVSNIIIAAASIINAISNGQNPDSIGLQKTEITNQQVHWQPKRMGNTIECHVIHIDRFENVVVNITKEQFESFGNNRRFSIQFARNAVYTISEKYSDVPQDEMLCRFNASGYLEIAINRGKAASLLGLKLNKEEHLIYRTIKIVFE